MADKTLIENGLIRVFDNGNGEHTVSARELHEFLESGRDFSNWIQDRIEWYGLREGTEFSTEVLKTPGGGRPRTEYWLTMRCAKELAMVENNEKGRMVRRYFITIEERYQQAAGMGTISPISVEEFLVHQAQAMLAQKRALEQVQAIAEGALAEVQETKQLAKVLEHRITNLDHIDIKGTLRQRLEGMVKLFARREGIHFPEGWKEFDRRFNTAFKTNLTARRKNFAVANGLKKVPSRPEYLEREGLLEDAIRVADKMLNPRRDGE
jgi:phage anti-repressor protein